MPASPGKGRYYTAEEFLELGEQGVVAERAELIYGEIQEMSPAHRRHARLQSRLMKLLLQKLDDSQYGVLDGCSVECADDSVPMPDISVERQPQSNDGVPAAEQLVIAIEISDSTLDTDRRVKAPLYAASGIPEYWIVDVNGRTIEVYLETAPGSREYAPAEIRRAGDIVTPRLLPSVAINVSEVFAVLE